MDDALWHRQQENLWITMARAGDLLAFNQLVLSYQDAAFRTAKGIVSDEACAEDIVQTVFFTAYRRISSFRTNQFRAWLLRMVRNACIDELRRRKRHTCLALESQDIESEIVKIAQYPIDRRAPEEALIQHETWEWIEQGLLLLPEPMREVLILIDIECLNYAEAARTLGIPLGTVKSRLGRARAYLFDILQDAHQASKAQF